LNLDDLFVFIATAALFAAAFLWLVYSGALR
jgi:hypothetical protein